ncbi:MAG: hypothetical protein IPN99_07460 [Bacteroidetes bacterium]|nr:hypothetical protein [Bacteroidota bacterium]
MKKLMLLVAVATFAIGTAAYAGGNDKMLKRKLAANQVEQKLAEKLNQNLAQEKKKKQWIRLLTAMLNLRNQLANRNCEVIKSIDCKPALLKKGGFYFVLSTIPCLKSILVYCFNSALLLQSSAIGQHSPSTS